MKRKIFAALTVISIIFSVFAGIAPVSAEDMESLKARQQQLQNDIAANENKLNELDDSTRQTEEYLALYDEKMKNQEALVESLNEQAVILSAQNDELLTEIADTEIKVEVGIADFRKRLRAMYMSRSNSLASVLAGSTSFYDILVSMEFIERVAERDDALITGLNEQIDELNIKKTELTGVRTELDNTIALANLEQQRLSAI
jgi:peptidoglycan hydrolase CwlO-like protein